MASDTIANGTSEIIHKLDLSEYGLDNVPDDTKSRAKSEVASYLENQILREVAAGISPVKGEGRFQRVEKEYATKEKNGKRLSNLENDGDLLDDFKVLNTVGNDFLSVGHKGAQVPKSDGHNQLSTKAKTWAIKSGFPRRRYIPDDNQKFIPKITDKIKSIIKQFVPEKGSTIIFLDPNIDSTVSTPEETGVTTSNIFDDDIIDSLLADAVRRRNNGL